MGKRLKKIWNLVRLFRIDKDGISTGSNKPKKQVTINLTKKHLYFSAILFVILISSFYFGIINNSWMGTTTYIKCTDGTTEVYNINKTMYCGENISDYYERQKQEQTKYINIDEVLINEIQ